MRLFLCLFLVCNAHGAKFVKAFPKVTFERPTFLVEDPQITKNYYVIEQKGKIWAIKNNKKTLLVDLWDRVHAGGNEEGLLGMTFDPNKESRYFYLYYSAKTPRRSVISRFTLGNNIKDSEKIILEINQPYSNHNGGMITFGPDGYLYIGVGDGGFANDPHEHGQNLNTHLGTILRIKPTKNGYEVPADNPFIGKGKKEIYAYGLRNPWRFSFDSKTDKLWVADVGQNKFEEVSIVDKGDNLGWNLKEGNHDFINPKNISHTKKPIIEYDHSQGQSITGGYVYYGSSIKGLRGQYIYADYVSGKVWRYNQKRKKSIHFDTIASVSSFAIDNDNELYLLSFDGHIYKLIP